MLKYLGFTQEAEVGLVGKKNSDEIRSKDGNPL